MASLCGAKLRGDMSKAKPTNAALWSRAKSAARSKFLPLMQMLGLLNGINPRAAVGQAATTR